jgi:hypothetical protein
MKVRLERNIHHHSPETGLTSKIVFKDYEWDILPIIGATIDDSAWHRNDIPKIENINIIAEEANIYYVELTSKKVDEASHVNKLVDVVKLHGWKAH